MNNMIKSIRRKLNITQKQFAYKTGVNQSYVAWIETDRCPASEKFLKKVVKKFHVNEDYLFHNKGKMFKEVV